VLARGRGDRPEDDADRLARRDAHATAQAQHRIEGEALRPRQRGARVEGCGLGEAAAFDPGATLSGTEGFTLDPVLSLRRVVRVPSGKKVSVIFWTIAAPNREKIDQAIERYRHPDSFSHELIHAWTRAQVELRHIGITSQQAAAFQHLGRYLVYPDTHLRADPETVRNGLATQSALWPLAISGDYPIFALRINDDMDMDIAREAMSALEYLRRRGIVADLAIVNERATSYAPDMQHALDQLADNLRHRLPDGSSGKPHVFVVRNDLMDESASQALIAAARVVLHARNGKIVDQINRAVSLFANPRSPDGADAEWPGLLPQIPSAPAPVVTEDPKDLAFWNGFGGFAKDGKEYVVRLGAHQATPQPWINVVSNEHFGFHVSAEGAGFTWSANSRDHQLTPWTNDPIVNRPGEAFYVADLESGRTYVPFNALNTDDAARFETRHGLGYSVFSSRHEGLELELTQTVDRTRPVKLSRLVVRNTGSELRTFRIYGYAEWVLGNNAQRSAPFVLSNFDEETGALFATNPYDINYPGRTAFRAGLEKPLGYTASRREFIGRHGSIRMPQALARLSHLSGSAETESDPCAALAFDIEVPAGSERDLTFLLGETDTAEAAREIIAALRKQAFEAVLEEAKAFWAGFTGKLQVKTEDPAFDTLVNGWLPYQALACRIFARAGFYQASGAYGFRDQLQDTLAFLLYEPGLARRQILNAASRQFIEGDVQHWWLPNTGAGVRTHISDDVVWLAHAIDQYVAATGDKAFLDETLAFLKGPVLPQDQHDSFFQPNISSEEASLYEHAARALDLAIARTGVHGLPLILGGDWNDGMNRVGEKGEGESVWLGWFLAATLKTFLGHAEERGDQARITRWTTHLAVLRQALATAAWDGDYYRRGYFDDGTPLGSAQSDECRIDSIAQSWSVLSGEGEPEKSTKALDAALAHLVDEEAGIVRLFTPPFEKTKLDPGYIKAYPPGVRENGGQYTHAAIWLGMALAKAGRAADAWRCFELLNPINHARDTETAEQYRVEPYVVAADIYGGEAYAGRGGWTWYTGSAGWLYTLYAGSPCW